MPHITEMRAVKLAAEEHAKVVLRGFCRYVKKVMLNLCWSKSPKVRTIVLDLIFDLLAEISQFFL